MKKTLSVLVAVLMLSVAFAQTPSRIINSGLRLHTNAKQALRVSNPAHAAGMAAAKTTYDWECNHYIPHPCDEDGYFISPVSDEINDWWIEMSTASGAEFYFDILGSTLTSGVVYTWDDMDPNYSFGRLSEEEDGWKFASASFTFTENASDGSVYVVAQAIDSAGNIYNLTYTIPSMEDAIDTIDVEIADAAVIDYSETNGSFLYFGFTVDSSYYSTLRYYATEMLGSFSFSDFVSDDNAVGVLDPTDGSYNSFPAINGHITVTEGLNGMYDIVAYLLSEDYHCYHVTMSLVPPIATDTIDVNVPQALLLETPATWFEDGLYNWTGLSDDDEPYSVEIEYGGYDVEGDFSFVDLATTSNISGILFQAGHVSVVPGPATGAYDLEAYLVGADLHCYHITMAYTLPTFEDAIDTLEVVLVNPSFVDYTTVTGDYYFVGYTADSSMAAQIDYFNTTVAGSYVEEDFDMDYTVLYSRSANGYTAIPCVTVKADVTDQNGAYDVSAYFLGNDLHCYHVTAHYVIPVATDTIDVVVPEAALENVAASWFSDAEHNWTGATADSAYDVAISYSGDNIAGDFVYAYLQSNSNINGIDFVDGHMTVVAGAESGEYNLEAYLIGSDMHCYHITMAYVLPTALDTIDIQILNSSMIDQIEDYGWFQLRGWSTDGNYYATFSNIDDRAAIAGTYDFESFDLDFTYVIVVNGTDTSAVDLIGGHADVTATATGYQLEAYFLGEDVHCYHITMIYNESGINTAKMAPVKVYPNPATEVLHIEAEGITLVEVLDMTGRVVLSSSQMEGVLHIGALSNGIYMLRTTTTEGINVQKIVKK